MADDVATTQAIGNGFFTRQLTGVWRSDVTGFCFFYGPSISYVKTTDAGVTWDSLVRLHVLVVGTSIGHWAAWYDGWTRAPTNNRFYFCWIERTLGSTTGTLYFQRFNISTENLAGSLATRRTIASLPNITTGDEHVQICVAQDGSLMITAYWGDSNFQSWVSDTGHIWTEAGEWPGIPVLHARQYLAPGNIGPGSFRLVEFIFSSQYVTGPYNPNAGVPGWQNFAALDSGITRTNETTLAPDNGFIGYRHSDQHALFVSFTDALENPTNTLRLYDLVVADEVADVFTDAAGNFSSPGVIVDHQSDDIIVFYMERLSGQQQFMRRISTDGGATWSAAVKLNDVNRAYEMLGMAPCNVIGLGRVQPFYNNTLGNPTDTIYNSNSTSLFCPTRTVGPEIQVLHKRILIDCGGTIDIGKFTVGETVIHQLTIRNDGDATLILGTLTDAGDITIVSSDDPSGQNVAPGGFTTVSVLLDTSTDGAKSGSISIPSNDADENPCVINFTADVNAIPVDVCNRYRCRMPGPGLRRDQLGFVDQP